MTSNQIPEGMSGPGPSATPSPFVPSGSGNSGSSGIPEGDSGPDIYSATLPDWQALTVIGPSGRKTTISYGYAVSQGWVPGGLTKDAYISGNWANRVQRTYYDWQLGGGGSGGGGGGGGGGSIGPIFQASATDFVRENMKAYVVAVTGTADASLIDAATNEFLKKEKERFHASVDNAPEDIDPTLAAYGVVRKSKAYLDIHELRPDSVDEMEWVVDRQTKLRQLGLSASLASEVGVEQARFGSSDEGLVGAGEVAQFQQTGRLLATQRERLKQSARAAIGLVR